MGWLRKLRPIPGGDAHRLPRFRIQRRNQLGGRQAWGDRWHLLAAEQGLRLLRGQDWAADLGRSHGSQRQARFADWHARFGDGFRMVWQWPERSASPSQEWKAAGRSPRQN